MNHHSVEFISFIYIKFSRIFADPFQTDKNVSEDVLILFAIVKSYYISISIVIQILLIDIKEISIAAENKIYKPEPMLFGKNGIPDPVSDQALLFYVKGDVFSKEINRYLAH